LTIAVPGQARFAFQGLRQIPSIPVVVATPGDRAIAGGLKPSSVASYEPGERMISLERLLALADDNDVPPEHLVAAVSQRLSTQADRIGIAATGSGSSQVVGGRRVGDRTP
jgi:transcriptional regulator with XRE-family HTH domain